MKALVSGQHKGVAEEEQQISGAKSLEAGAASAGAPARGRRRSQTVQTEVCISAHTLSTSSTAFVDDTMSGRLCRSCSRNAPGC